MDIFLYLHVLYLHLLWMPSKVMSTSLTLPPFLSGVPFFLCNQVAMLYLIFLVQTLRNYVCIYMVQLYMCMYRIMRSSGIGVMRPASLVPMQAHEHIGSLVYFLTCVT